MFCYVSESAIKTVFSSLAKCKNIHLCFSAATAFFSELVLIHPGKLPRCFAVGSAALAAGIVVAAVECSPRLPRKKEEVPEHEDITYYAE